MKAVILAGGFGKRLMPLTESIPKALVKVGGRPILYWELKWLKSHGITDIVILAGNMASKIVEYTNSMGYDARIQFSIESRPVGSAGALKKAYSLLKDEEMFLLLNGDNITDYDISRLKLPGWALCCLSLKPYRSRSGIAQVKGDRVTYFREKPIIEGYWNNADINLVSSKLLRSLPKEGTLVTDVFPALIKQKKLSCVRFTKGYHRAVDTFKDYQEIDSDLKAGKVKI